MTPALETMILSAFAPAQVYRASPIGLWLDPSDIASGYQDSAGTTAAAVDQPIGKASDKSGAGLNVVQATADARPLLKFDGAVYSFLLDGTDDGLATAAFSAGTLTSDMDCLIAFKRGAATDQILMADSIPDKFFAGFGPTAGLANSGVGTEVTYFVNGVQVTGGKEVTRPNLSAAIPVGAWVIVEARNIDLSLILSLSIGLFASYRVNGNVGGVILCKAQTDMVRTRIRRFLARKVGVAV